MKSLPALLGAALAAGPAPAPAAQDAGRALQLYAEQCLVCHQAEGAGLPPVYPSLRDSALVRGPGEEVVRVVVEGRGAMPAFGATMAPGDLIAVVGYVRALAGVDDAPGALRIPGPAGPSGDRTDDL